MEDRMMQYISMCHNADIYGFTPNVEETEIPSLPSAIDLFACWDILAKYGMPDFLPNIDLIPGMKFRTSWKMLSNYVLADRIPTCYEVFRLMFSIRKDIVFSSADMRHLGAGIRIYIGGENIEPLVWLDAVKFTTANGIKFYLKHDISADILRGEIAQIDHMMDMIGMMNRGERIAIYPRYRIGYNWGLGNLRRPARCAMA